MKASMTRTRNIGPADRALRSIGGLAIGGLALLDVFPGTLSAGAYAVAAVLLVTAAVGASPLYAALGIDTCRTHMS